MKKDFTFPSVRDWAANERPREKLQDKGGPALSNAELLAVLLVSGTKGKNCVDIGRKMLQLADDDWTKLWKLGLADLQKVPGIGSVQALKIKAMCEIARRSASAMSANRPKIVTSLDAFNNLRIELADLDHEEFWVLFLSRRSKLLLKKQISSGGINSTVVDPRIIFKVAMDEKASSIILAHNHPSGSLNPSQADVDLTNKLVAAGKFLDVQVIDHLILAGKNYCSFADSGLL
ncbi:MAG TPA: DNA repair protein RadC [Cyclobacteriaceae bacterium]